MALILPLALPFVILLAIAVFGVLASEGPSRLQGPGSAGSLVWGDGIFQNRQELKAWLELHGGSYPSWAKQHPAALALVRPKQKGRVKPKTVGAKPRTLPRRTTPRTTTQAVSRPSSADSVRPRRSTQPDLVLWMVVAFGILAGLAASAPRAMFLSCGLGSRISEARFATAALGMALLLGAIVPLLLG